MMTEPVTPESLLEFFRMLAPEGEDEAAPCQIHYGCLCVLRKGLLAARLLVEARSGVPDSGGIPAEGGTPEPAPPDDILIKAIEKCLELEKDLAAAREAEQAQAAALAAEKTRADGLLKQNMKLANENIELRQKTQILQRQVNRLYDTMQMKSIHTAIRKDEVEPAPATAPTPAPEPVPARSAPVTLEEDLQTDSAARVPREAAPPAPPAAQPSAENNRTTEPLPQ